MKALVARQRAANLNPRRHNLITTIRTQGGVWRAGDVMSLYRANGWGCNRSTAATTCSTWPGTGSSWSTARKTTAGTRR